MLILFPGRAQIISQGDLGKNMSFSWVTPRIESQYSLVSEVWLSKCNGESMDDTFLQEWNHWIALLLDVVSSDQVQSCSVEVGDKRQNMKNITPSELWEGILSATLDSAIWSL